jgi:hypothetical protein
VRIPSRALALILGLLRGLFAIGEKGLHPHELLSWDPHALGPNQGAWRGGTPPKPCAGDFTRVRSIARAQLRLELTRFFYDPQTPEDKRCASVQVTHMMTLLNEHLEPLSYEGDDARQDAHSDSGDAEAAEAGGEKRPQTMQSQTSRKSGDLLINKVGLGQGLAALTPTNPDLFVVK